ncbi:TetR/AcrR family transcriptional regulator [Marinactinospora thermotolerans]|nr:TetR/AcrR family transcriptional regulator [Marinactinospora thermotolerans]
MSADQTRVLDAAHGGHSRRGSGETRDRLVEAAWDLVAEGGPEAVTLRAVGERVGVSRTAPYRHFRDKSDLLAAVAARGFELLRAETAQVMAGRDGSLDSIASALRAGCVAYVRAGLARPRHYRLMFGEAAAGCDDDTVHGIASASLAEFAEVLAEGQRAGAVRSGDAVEFAFLTWAMLHGLVDLALSGHFARKGISVEEAAARAATRWFHGPSL